MSENSATVLRCELVTTKSDAETEDAYRYTQKVAGTANQKQVGDNPDNFFSIVFLLTKCLKSEVVSKK
jgi:hypothetical protein